jgi:hypothetical protein
MTSAWDVLQALDTYRVVQMPRARDLSERAAESDAYREQRLAVMVSAFHANNPLFLGWLRPAADGLIEVYVGGSGIANSASPTSVVDELAMLSLPTGGRGKHMPYGAAANAFAELPYWTHVTAMADVWSTDQISHEVATRLKPSLEDCLLDIWPAPFAWFVLAEPVAGNDLRELTAYASDQQRHARAKAGSSPDHAVQAQYWERRHRELSLSRSTGLWRARILAGGRSPTDTIQLAALLCASIDCDGLPYTFIPGSATSDLKAAVNAGFSTERGGSPIEIPTALMARIAKPPTTEIPGIQFRLRSEFDVTHEADMQLPYQGNPPIRLGTIVDRNQSPASPLLLPQSSLNRHTFVCGATGAGKSQTIRGLLEASTAHRLPWLVIEPAKAEYRFMAARLARIGESVNVIRPGDVDAPPAGINPLEPAVDSDGSRFPLQTHIDLVRALFLAAFDAEEPFPQVLAAALTRCYEQLGWDLVLGEPALPGTQPRYPTLADLQHTAEAVVNDIGYGKEITDNVRGFVAVRLGSLRQGTPGRFFAGGHPIDMHTLLRRNVVFEIEDVGNDSDKAFFMGTVLIRLVEQLRLEQRGHNRVPRLRHLSVIEEAHRLLRHTEQPGPASYSVDMIAALLAEIRAYGEGLIIAEQIPVKLLPDVIKNTAVKIVHRLPALDDREAVGSTMNMTAAQSEYLVTLQPGHAAVFTDGMDYPVLATMPDGTLSENVSNATPAEPMDLITPRSVTCGAFCQDQPCSLREIRAAHHVLDANPAIVLWIELAVVAHLTGWTTPIPHPPLLNEIKAVAPRALDCALSHAVDAAVASRSTVMTRRVSPGGLAAHVVHALRDHIATGRPHIGEEPEWLAPSYRWCYVWDALKNDSDVIYDGRHPRSAEWEEVYSQIIPGDTRDEQLATVTRWFDDDQQDNATLNSIAFGAYSPSAIAATVGALPSKPDWTDRLTRQLKHFTDCRWPLQVLAGTASTVPRPSQPNSRAT